MYANDKRTLLEMFVDRTIGESTRYNRLVTRETDAGNTALIAYGWMKLAEYDEERDTVTIFAGHKAIDSKTVAHYLNDVRRVAELRNRDVIITGASPEWSTPNDGVRFINNYISMTGSDSAVERDARNSVHEDLAHLS